MISILFIYYNNPVLAVEKLSLYPKDSNFNFIEPEGTAEGNEYWIVALQKCFEMDKVG